MLKTRAALPCFVALSLLLAPATPATAKSAWWQSAEIGVKVHEHAFHRMTANAIGCKVRVRLYFDAPYASYRDAAAERNRYRFRAEVKLSDGKRFVSEVFDNSEAGLRVFEFSHDTQGAGCWAESEHKLRKLDVHACRGERCAPEVFE